MSDTRQHAQSGTAGKTLVKLDNVGPHSHALINFAFEDQELSISDSDSSITNQENRAPKRAKNVILE